jgi:hypothetical protein
VSDTVVSDTPSMCLERLYHASPWPSPLGT